MSKKAQAFEDANKVGADYVVLVKLGKLAFYTTYFKAEAVKKSCDFALGKNCEVRVWKRAKGGKFVKSEVPA